MSLTICVLTCGEDTTNECLRVLEERDSRTILRVISGVEPQAEATRRLFSECSTSHLMQLDADTILYSGWFDRVSKFVESWRPRQSHLLLPLYDTLTMSRIGAVKIFFWEAVEGVRIEDIRVPDVAVFQYLHSAGYIGIDLVNSPELPIGKHVVRGDRACYSRFKDGVLSNRLHAAHFRLSTRDHVADRYIMLRRLHELTGDPDYLYCMAGLADGIVSENFSSKKASDSPMFDLNEAQTILSRYLSITFL